MNESPQLTKPETLAGVFGGTRLVKVEKLPNGKAFYFDVPVHRSWLKVPGRLEMLVRRLMAGGATPSLLSNMQRGGVGDSGVPVKTQVIVFQVSLTPASVATIVAAEQLLTVTGILTTDIVVAAIGIPELIRGEWIKPGALVVPYGTMSAVELSLTDIMNKVVVDDWGQCRKGLPYGALRQHVDLGKITEENLHAELGQIVAGIRPGRENDQETILFWHRGLSLSDIALGDAMLKKARALSLGQTLRFA